MDVAESIILLIKAFLPSRTFSIQSIYLHYLHTQIKTHEGRSADSRLYKTTRPGDVVRLVDEYGRWALFIREDACMHHSMQTFLTCNKHPHLLPNITDINTQKNIYAEFGVTDVAAECYGVVAIRLRPFTPLCMDLHDIIAVMIFVLLVLLLILDLTR